MNTHNCFRKFTVPFSFIVLITLLIGCTGRQHAVHDPGHDTDREARLPENTLQETVAEAKPGIPSPVLPGSNVRVNQDPTARDQVETTMAADPSDPLHLVAAWNSYYSEGWANGSLAGYGWSFDGGKTWDSALTDKTHCPETSFSCDPSMAFDNLGNLFYGFMDSCGIWVTRSTDGGRTFDLLTEAGSGDKPYISTNPQTDDVYITYSKSHEIHGSFTIHFSKSTDSGVSFGDPVVISNGSSNGNGPLPRTGTGGQIYIVWSNISAGAGDVVFFDRSMDGGSTWLADDISVNPDIVQPTGPLGFNNWNIPSMAVDWSNGPYRGRVYVIWADGRYGDRDIMLAWSDDDGDTWSAPVKVNDDVVGNGAPQFFPWISVDDDGHVHVTFLDRRDDPDDYLFSMYLATSTDGGASFGPNIRISDGFYGPGSFGFMGDYTGNTTAGQTLHAAWPDARHGDTDIYTQAVDLVDYDADGILNDGNDNGQYADAPCTGGQTAGCDDNCPGVSNPAQEDQDGDGVGDACDNCPGTANATQENMDRDGYGDICDACEGAVGGDGGDKDGDGVVNCSDNCPEHANAGQADEDGDGIGDPCDPCPGDSINDVDRDGLCGSTDNCPEVYNRGQVDSDGDGVGDPCDTCPDLSDPGQEDGDGDGRGDLCDCQAYDRSDRTPPDTTPLRAFHDGTTTHFALVQGTYDDLYSVVRGNLSSLRDSADYGGCFLDGAEDKGFDDTEVPPVGDGFFYLVQGQNLDCGMGFLGFDSDGGRRHPSSPCSGVTYQDVYAVSEDTNTGVRTGDYTLTLTSDDVYESITETTFMSFVSLSHTWTFDVPAGSRIWLHAEGYLSENDQNEIFYLNYEPSDGSSTFALWIHEFSDPDQDYSSAVRLDANGTVHVNVGDRIYVESVPHEDTVYIDQLWFRVVP